MDSGSSQEFFDEISAEYTASIDRCVPRYREMLWALLHYLPPEWNPRTIVELGCGSGNLSELLCQRFPMARIKLVDFSSKLIQECRNRLPEQVTVEFVNEDFRELEFEPGTIDLVVSTISLHHLTDPEKAGLFRNTYGWLSDHGIFTYSDQFAGATDDLYARQMDDWKQRSEQLGATDEEWRSWMEHQQRHDHHATLTDQVDWLRTAGFTTIDCPWRYILWTVLQARK